MNYPRFIEVGGKKYKINTDFRVALECAKIAEDKSIGDYERTLAIIYKLFGEEALNDFENRNEIIELALKYMLCGKEKEQSNEKPDMDFEQDIALIEASFMSDYKIDLENTQMHWWKFMALMNGLSYSELGGGCVLNNVRMARRKDPSTIKDAKARAEFIEYQKSIALEKDKAENNLTKEQKESMERLNKIIGI